MPKDKSTGKKLADMMYGNPDRAAFGITPMIGKRREDRQDREAAKSFPVDLARGVTAGFLGMPADILNIPGAVYSAVTDKDLYKIPYGSEDILKSLPFGTDTPAGQFASGLGALAGGSANIGPMIRGAKALPGALKTAARNLSTPSTLNPQAGVIKTKGGNWQSGSIEKALKPLKRNTAAGNDPVEMLSRMRERYTPEEIAKLPEGVMRTHVLESIADLEKDVALNNWVERNLGNYVKKEMATPEDPVRRLAEEGISHLPENTRMPRNMSSVVDRREAAGFPEAQGKSQQAQVWEALSDDPIRFATAGEMQNVGRGEPWMEKADPFTRVHSIGGLRSDSMTSELGFDHIMDVLRQDLAEGRIRPEQLNKVSMEQAIRRTYEYDQEMAKKMRETALKQQEGFPVYKEYPEGYRWIELNQPKDLPEGWKESAVVGTYYDEAGNFQQHPREKIIEDALKYEGDTMGHCVGGYCPDVLEGRSRIYSLRDAKGEPHVTVEVNPSSQRVAPRHEEILAEMKASGLDTSKLDESAYDAAYEQALQRVKQSRPPAIVQIKGKQNRAPKEEYLPFVQDFVKSGQWSHVGDLQNTGLYRMREGKYGTQQELDAELKPRMASALKFLNEHEAFKEQHAARQRRDAELFNLPYEEQHRLENIYGTPLFPGSHYSANELSRYIADPGENISRMDEYYPNLSRWVEEVERAQQHYLTPPPEGMKRGGRVHISDNPDVMALELAGGGAVRMQAGGIAKLAKLARAPAKSKQEIQAIAERMAPQVTGEYVRESAKSAKTVAGKTQKQFQREKSLPVDVRPTDKERTPKAVDIEKLKDEVMIGIPGDPTLAGKTLYGVGDVRLGSPSPQHGGPLYGLYNDPNFWASGEDAAKKVQNLARSASELYDAPVLGNYIMMGPDSLGYAQHFADANLQAIDLSKMTKQQIEMFNEIIREGYNYKKKGERFQRVFPSFPGIEDKDSAYLHMAMDPDLRKHFNEVMQKPTVTEPLNLPSGQDIRFAITEPALRDLESGVTGYSIGRMRPDVSSEGLKLSQHPTYSHDIPGQFMGTSKYPMPYELTFPDTVKSIRENPRQAPYEFGTLQYGSTHQTIDQQMIDEIRAYEERMKQLTGKKAGGAVRKAGGGEVHGLSTADLLFLQSQEDLGKLPAHAQREAITNMGGQEVRQRMAGKMAAGGEITADDLILEERKL
jgi:hypothetical protein